MSGATVRVTAVASAGVCSAFALLAGLELHAVRAAQRALIERAMCRMPRSLPRTGTIHIDAWNRMLSRLVMRCRSLTAGQRLIVTRRRAGKAASGATLVSSGQSSMTTSVR